MPPTDVSTTTPHQSIMARLTGRLFYPVAVLLIAASLTAFYFIFWSPWQDAENGRGDLSTAAAQQVNADDQTQLATLKRHDDQLSSVAKSDLDRMSIALPTGPATPELLVQIEALSLESGMNDAVASVDLGNGSTAPLPELNNRVQQLTGHFDFKAVSYEQLKSIIDVVQKNLRLFDITNVSYDPTTGGASVDFVTYYLPS